MVYEMRVYTLQPGKVPEPRVGDALVVEQHLFAGEPAHALNEAALHLAAIDGGHQRGAHVVDDEGADAERGQSGDFGEEGRALARLRDRVQGDLELRAARGRPSHGAGELVSVQLPSGATPAPPLEADVDRVSSRLEGSAEGFRTSGGGQQDRHR